MGNGRTANWSSPGRCGESGIETRQAVSTGRGRFPGCDIVRCRPRDDGLHRQVDLYDYLGGGSSSSGATTGSTTPAPPAGGPSGSSAALQTTGNALAPDMAAADDAKPIADLYNKALKSLQNGSYKEAAKDFPRSSGSIPIRAGRPGRR